MHSGLCRVPEEDKGDGNPSVTEELMPVRIDGVTGLSRPKLLNEGGK